MSVEFDLQSLADACIGQEFGNAQLEGTTPEQIEALLGKRQSVGRRNIGRLICEVERCPAICIVKVHDGLPEAYSMSEITKLLGDCVYWNTVTADQDPSPLS